MQRKIRAKAEDGVEGAKRAAVSLLAYKENTERELSEKLAQRGYSREEIAEAISYAKSKRYLDEERYYRRFVENAANVRLLGKQRILQAQREKRFSAETLEKCAEECFSEIDFEGNCLLALRKIHRGDIRKTAAALMRRGFSSAQIRYAAQRFTAEEREKNEEEE